MEIHTITPKREWAYTGYHFVSPRPLQSLSGVFGEDTPINKAPLPEIDDIYIDYGPYNSYIIMSNDEILSLKGRILLISGKVGQQEVRPIRTLAQLAGVIKKNRGDGLWVVASHADRLNALPLVNDACEGKHILIVKP